MQTPQPIIISLVHSVRCSGILSQFVSAYVDSWAWAMDTWGQRSHTRIPLVYNTNTNETSRRCCSDAAAADVLRCDDSSFVSWAFLVCRMSCTDHSKSYFSLACCSSHPHVFSSRTAPSCTNLASAAPSGRWWAHSCSTLESYRPCRPACRPASWHLCSHIVSMESASRCTSSQLPLEWAAVHDFDDDAAADSCCSQSRCVYRLSSECQRLSSPNHRRDYCDLLLRRRRPPVGADRRESFPHVECWWCPWSSRRDEFDGIRWCGRGGRIKRFALCDSRQRWWQSSVNERRDGLGWVKCVHRAD